MEVGASASPDEQLAELMRMKVAVDRDGWQKRLAAEAKDQDSDQERLGPWMVDRAIRGTAEKVARIKRSLHDQLRDPNADTQEKHEHGLTRARLLLDVSRLLQEGEFGDSSDEEDDLDDYVQNPPRKVATVAATSQTEDALEPASKASGSAATSLPLAPQAHAFVREKGLDELEDFKTNAIFGVLLRVEHKATEYVSIVVVSSECVD